MALGGQEKAGQPGRIHGIVCGSRFNGEKAGRGGALSPHDRQYVRVVSMPRVVRCPICQAEVYWEGNPHRPFCSERCRFIDLGAWTEGRYRIAGPDLEQDSEKENGDDEEGSP